MEIARQGIREWNTHRFAIDASEAGLKPGQWPREITVPGLGNGRPFLPVAKKTLDGDLLYVRYFQEFGCCDLTIYND